MITDLGDPEATPPPDTITIDLNRLHPSFRWRVLAWAEEGFLPTATFASEAFWREVEALERSADVEACSWIVQPTYGPARRCFGKNRPGGGADRDLGIPLCRDHAEHVLRRATEYLATKDAVVVARAIDASRHDGWASREVRRLIDNEISRRMEERWAA